MTYKVSLSSDTFSVKQNSSGSFKVSLSLNTYSTKKTSEEKFKVSAILGTGASEVANLSDLADVNVNGIQNGYVLTYNSSTGKFVAVNPDNILTNAVTGGLPTDFIDELHDDLDKIHLDAGGF